MMGETDNGKYKKQLNRTPSAASLKKVPHPDEGRVRHYNQTWSVVIGLIFLCCALLSIIIGIVAVIVESEFHEFGPGIWAGMFFLVPGVFGIVSRNKMRCLVFGFLGTSVFSLVISSNMIVILSIGLSTDHIENDVAAMVVNIIGIALALIAMLTSLFAIVLCSIPFCRPPECPNCSSKQGIENLAFQCQKEQHNPGPELSP